MSLPGAFLSLLGLHALVGVLAGPVFRLVGRRAFLVLALAPGALFSWCVFEGIGLASGAEAHSEALSWAPSLHFDLAIRVDWFSLVMLGIVSGVGVLVLVYSTGYFGGTTASSAQTEQSHEAIRRLARIGGLLVLFAGSMAGLVASDGLLSIFMFWELTSVISYLLIGTEDQSPSARAAAFRAYVITAAGGLAMLAGFVILAERSGTWFLSSLMSAPPHGTAVNVAVVLVLVGAFTKSAQFPFHFWLAPAMAAPTPVSAYLHSATMVKAGVYLIARFSVPFADIPPWRPLVIGVGAVTMLLGAWRALAQSDLKVLLAHGTVSQLGFMVILFGLGRASMTQAAVALLVAHALFKAALFLAVGAIDTCSGTRKIEELPSLWPRMRAITVVTVVASASMAGVPPLIGFVAKEAAIASLLDGSSAATRVSAVVVVIGSVLTFAYSARIVGGVLGRFSSGDPYGSAQRVTIDGPGSPPLVVPGILLVALTILFGILPRLIESLIDGSVRVLTRTGRSSMFMEPSGLSLWHGFNAPLLVSAAIIGSGAVLWSIRGPLGRIQDSTRSGFSAAKTFDLAVAKGLRLSDVVIGRIQTGSLPFYLLVILSTALILPAVAIIGGDRPRLSLVFAQDPAQVVTAILITVVALGAVVTRHRLGAVLCVGATGYGVAVMFMLWGAPDLALTQMLVETLALVVFVLVLRHLPKRFSFNQTAFSVLPRALLSIAVGVGAALFVLYSYAARPSGTQPVSNDYMGASADAGGHNVVNVILVEFRAFDTFGEISVLTVAALGILGLVRASRRDRPADATKLRPPRPSFLLDSAANALFQTLILVSLILLFGGHDDPGGGFIAGLVAGSAFILIYLSGGDSGLRQREPLAAEAFLGLGVVASFVAGAIGWTGGGTFLQSRSWRIDLPVVDHVVLSTSLLFEVGVYLVVLGLIMSILRSLGREEVYEQ